MPLFQGLIPFREPSSSVFLDLARILSWFTRLLMSLLPVLAFALPGAILLGQAPAAPVQFFAEKKALVTQEQDFSLLIGCLCNLEHSVDNITMPHFHVASLPVAADQREVRTDEGPRLQVTLKIGHVSPATKVLQHHLNSGLLLAGVAVPPRLPLAEDLHEA